MRPFPPDGERTTLMESVLTSQVLGSTRRAWLASASATAWALARVSEASAAAAQTSSRPADEPFGYCLNTSTIRGQKLGLDRESELAAAAGFHALEPWISELDDHVKSGGSLETLGRGIAGMGLTIESAIGFFEWCVDDDARRKKAVEQARRDMEKVRAVGGKRLAAPPVGATDRSGLDPKRIAERYRTLLDIGDEVGIVPEVEVWGFSQTLGNLAEAAAVAIGAGHPKACILADVYHLYKGGSGLKGVRLLNGETLPVIHLNDYPADPPRAKITDADRVYPGDGVAPLGEFFRDLRAIGFRGYLSVELFNRRYWQDDPKTVLRTAIAKTRAAVKSALR
jgi:sugar phosphate isomerase/epimerase